MKVPKDQKWNFAYVMPDKDVERKRIVFPSDLHMGCCHSPEFFCTATEAAEEVMTRARAKKQKIVPSQTEHFMEPAEPVEYTPCSTELLQVFVDDFIFATQSESTEDLKELLRTALAAIFSVLPPPKESGNVNGRDPVSEKKMNKGDGKWSHLKVILGFIFDGRRRSVQLPQDKLDKQLGELEKMLEKTRVPLQKYRKVVIKLRHSAEILPPGLGISPPTNKVLKGLPDLVPFGNKCEAQRNVLDLKEILKYAATQHMEMVQLVKISPDLVGYTDACATGMGGFWFSGNKILENLCWRVPFPKDIFDEVISDVHHSDR